MTSDELLKLPKHEINRLAATVVMKWQPHDWSGGICLSCDLIMPEEHQHQYLWCDVDTDGWDPCTDHNDKAAVFAEVVRRGLIISCVKELLLILEIPPRAWESTLAPLFAGRIINADQLQVCVAAIKCVAEADGILLTV